LEFESQVGDLTSILKVDNRRREALKEQFEDKQALLLVDRYRFLNLAPCTPEQLRYMGYAVSVEILNYSYKFILEARPHFWFVERNPIGNIAAFG
jgi:hypothetical protein